MNKRLLSLLILVLAVIMPMKLWAQEPYAVLSEDSTVLTFYYDDQKAARNGMSVGPFSGYPDYQTWYAQRESITSVVFDDSFAGCTTLTSTAYWFYEFENLTSITGISNLKTDNMTDMHDMFVDCSSLTSLDVTSFKTDNVTNMSEMFYRCSSLTSLDVSGFKTDNVTDVSGMFGWCSGLTSLDVSGFKTDNVTDMGGMFWRCSGLTTIDVSGFNTEKVTNMWVMFSDCSGLTSLDVSGFKTDNVTDMSYMFSGCSGLASLDVSGFKTANVTNMREMFYRCSSLMSLDVSGFKTDNVTSMYCMFRGCTGLTAVDVSGFNTDKVEYMNSMFADCSGLKTIFVGNVWSTASVTESNEMFSGCTNLVGGKGTVYNPDHVDASYAHIDGGASNPGYFTEKVNYNDGDIFTAETVEGIMLKYRVISEADKTCQVGTMVDTDSWISSDIANAVDDPMVEGTITIPEYAKGYRVIKIGYEAFINCTQVTSIVIPNTVTEITTAAMAQSGLTAITIPSSVSSIHYDFLHNCSNLESIVVEEGNQVYDSRNSCNALIETATNKLMMGCKTSTVPNGIETIGTAAFILCKGLTAIELPNTVTRIETQAFNSSDLSSINLPPSLEYIGYSCFAGSNVTSFVIPANVKEIMLGAFNCNGLTSIVVEQGNQVYDSRDNCNAIIETATNTLFEGFSVTVIPNSVTTIGSSAFREVWDLHEITIPESVAAIGEHAFIHTYLEKVTSERPEPVEIPDNAFSDNCYEQATLYVPQSSIEAYSTTGGWKNFKSILAIVEGGTAEPYAVLSEDSLTVTFYYDDQKTSRGGMDINNSILDNSNSPYGTATSAVFDVSFDAYRPTSTACWFENCSSLATINGIEYLHTDDVTNMSWMFECCFNLEELDLSNFNTFNVTEMYGMFLSCQGLKSLNVSSFNTSKVVGMNQMFCGLSNLTNLDLSNFDTSNVRWMYAMFADCPNLTSLDISSFNSALVSNMGDLFSNCVKLKTIYVGDGWTTTGVGENGNGLFNNCTNLIGGAGTVYAPDHIDYTYAHIDGGVSNPGYFTDKNAAPYVNPEPYVVLSDNNTVLTFYYDEKRNERNGIAIGSYGPGNYEPWYENRTTLTTAVFDESFANDTTLTSTAYWFFECIRMTEIKGLEYLKTDKVTDMRNMFYGCSKLTTLDVSHLKTDNVTNMNLMFYYCSGLTSLDVKGFNTENVTDMGSMFNNCSGLTSLDISSFKTEKVKDMIQMFYQCYNLTTIYAGNGWSTASVTADYGYHMFTDCTALVGGRGTTYDKDRANYLFAHIDGGASNPGYFTDKNGSTLNDGDTFTAVNSDGIELRYRVISAADKTCQVGDRADSNTLSPDDIASAVDTTVVGVINVPEQANGYKVVRVGYQAFVRCRNVTEVVLPNTVTELYLYSFAHSGIKRFTLPRSVSIIHYAALTETDSLETIIVDSENPLFDSRNNCNAIIETASNTLVRGCITSFVPDGITTIGSGAFLSCCAHDWTIELPNSVTRIETQAFNSCDLTDIKLSNNLQYVGYAAFGGSKLTSIVVPASVTEMGIGAFRVNSLTSLVVDEANSVFDSRDNCNAIIETATNTLVCGSNVAIIPNSVTAIGRYAFSELWNLKTITFPSSITRIDDHAFWFSNLETIISLIEKPFEISDNVFREDVYKRCELYVPAGTVDAYRNTPSWNLFQKILEIAPVIDYTFDSSTGVLVVNGETSLADALETAGGRAEVAKTITAIVWNSTSALTNSDLQGLDNPNLLLYVNDASQAPQGIQNVVVNGRAKNIVLTDTKEGNGNFYCPQAFTAENVSYIRDFKQSTKIGVSRGWESIALPFNVQTVTHEKQGMITPFGNSASKKHFWLRRLGDSGLTQATAIEANVPYVISMPNDEVNYAEEFNLSGRVTFTAQEVTIPVTEPVTLALADSTIKMVPAFQSIGRASDVWAINVGESRDQYLEGSVFERDYREVRPFEAYTVHTSDGSAPRFVPIQEIGSTTGIEDVRGLMSDGRGDKWYDLNGRRLQQKPTQKGVYMNNGRKVVIH